MVKYDDFKDAFNLEKRLQELKFPPILGGNEDYNDKIREIQEKFQKNVYGYLPKPPVSVEYRVIEEDKSFCAGKATLKKIELSGVLNNKSTFSFPFFSCIPNFKGKKPFFVHINFRENVPDKYQPTEEIIDNGFAILSFCYNDITMDNNDFSHKLAKAFIADSQDEMSACGKIAMWAWGAVRLMDYAQTIDELDKNNGAVIGHSRLGKTALFAGLMDNRFKYVISNNSGCGGAALSKEKSGENIEAMINSFPYWFCKKFSSSYNDEELEQHLILAGIAPRFVFVGSAAEDLWADPCSEYLSCVLASEMYEKAGVEGFLHPYRICQCSDRLYEGHIGYHQRRGGHYLSREDWCIYMEEILKKIKGV